MVLVSRQELSASGQYGLGRVARAWRVPSGREDSVRQEEEVGEGPPGVHGEDGG